MQNQEISYGFSTCCFKRTEDAPLEHGIILINSMGKFVISEQGIVYNSEQVLFKHDDFGKNFEKLCTLSLCDFQRQEKGPWERGVLINEGGIGIMDKYGMLVLECWDWRSVNGFYINVTDFLRSQPIE